MSKPRILIQLDTDAQPSVFDSVVAVDAGVNQMLRHGGVAPDSVRDLVHGAMFTRGPDDLRSTAIFIGGSNVAASEALRARVTECFFGPMRVSVLLDPNGANTTAAAAVRAAARHASLKGAEAVVLAATGPVGRRVVRLLALEGANVRVASRGIDRAQAVCVEVATAAPNAKLTAVEYASDGAMDPILNGARILIAAGSSGIQLVDDAARRVANSLRVAIDLNAVPPVGLEGIDVTANGDEFAGCVCYGAIGVGGLKMKIHKAAIRKLFESNDQVLDAEEIYALAGEIA